MRQIKQKGKERQDQREAEGFEGPKGSKCNEKYK
jgi:hypothetical protein